MHCKHHRVSRQRQKGEKEGEPPPEKPVATPIPVQLERQQRLWPNNLYNKMLTDPPVD